MTGDTCTYKNGNVTITLAGLKMDFVFRSVPTGRRVDKNYRVEVDLSDDQIREALCEILGMALTGDADVDRLIKRQRQSIWTKIKPEVWRERINRALNEQPPSGDRP